MAFDPVSAVAGIAQSGIDTFANWKMQQSTQDANVAQWMRENQYNTPEAQVQRLRNAKLNPALMYSSSANTGNTVTSAPRMQAPEVKSSALDEMNKFQSSNNLNQVNENLKIQNDIARAQATKENNEAWLSDRQAGLIWQFDQLVPAWLRDKAGAGGIIGTAANMAMKIFQSNMNKDIGNGMQHLNAIEGF
nr:MAG: DNA pilot protein [Microviridae sp.]